jgi:hypothetical protein
MLHFLLDIVENSDHYFLSSMELEKHFLMIKIYKQQRSKRKDIRNKIISFILPNSD